jgi:uncharacterized protein YerC
MSYPLFQHVYPEIVRYGGVTPDKPADKPPPMAHARPGFRRPHTDMTVAKVRDLIEHTSLSYEQITARTGVCAGTISCWTRDRKWVRPPDAARPWDKIPAHRASRRLKLRKLAGRLQSLAERYVRELEETPGTDVDRLMQALQVLRMARREASGNKRRRSLVGPPQTGRQYNDREQAIRAALKEMLSRSDIGPHPPVIRLGGVTPDKPADGPPAVVQARLPGSRRPHADMTYAEVRELIERTALSYEQIKARTGVDTGTISCWARDGGWARPLEAPRSSDRMPTFRARRRLKLRKLAGRLQMLAEHHVRPAGSDAGRRSRRAASGAAGAEDGAAGGDGQQAPRSLAKRIPHRNMDDVARASHRRRAERNAPRRRRHRPRAESGAGAVDRGQGAGGG